MPDYRYKKLCKCEFDEVDIIAFKDIKKYVECRDCLIIDLREPEEYKRSHVRGAINIEYNDSGIMVPYEYRNSLLIFYCDSGKRALITARNMNKLGYRTIAVADRFTH
jgi:rhodanese-related sulfurtransferase